MALVECVDKFNCEQRLRQIAQQFLQNRREVVARRALEQFVHLFRFTIEIRFQLHAYRLDLNTHAQRTTITIQSKTCRNRDQLLLFLDLDC